LFWGKNQLLKNLPKTLNLIENRMKIQLIECNKNMSFGEFTNFIVFSSENPPILLAKWPGWECSFVFIA